jgi:hypothetical protein
VRLQACEPEPLRHGGERNASSADTHTVPAMRADLAVDLTTPPMTWETFIIERPSYSIALDGYVSSGPRFDRSGPHLNVNHHEGVDRLATLATCEQVLRLARMGLRHTFQRFGQVELTAWVNDCDQDVCLSWWLLAHLDDDAVLTRLDVHRLVAVEGVLDATAGAYSFLHADDLLHQIAWVFHPYTQARTHGLLSKRCVGDYSDVIDAVGERIDAYLEGNADLLPFDDHFDIIKKGAGWAMISESGEHARAAVYGSGIDAFVTVSNVGDNLWCYTLARRSLFIDFDIPAMLEALEEAEQRTNTSRARDDMWGGSDLVGGSPRCTHSRLAPDDVYTIVAAIAKR